jgi:hypothetical protein
MKKLPEDVQKFLEEIIRQFSLGNHGEEFARWTATNASFILEFRDLLY